jgi:phage terminase large subunit-like protein
MDSVQHQYLRLQQEALKRAKDDPLLNFKPHAKQKAFIDAVLNPTKYLILFFAANRAGKSDAGAVCGANLARFGPKNPRSIYMGSGKDHIEVRDRSTSGWVVSLDFNNSQEVIQPKYFDNGFVPPGSNRPFIPAREIAEWRIKDQVLKLKNGSLIGFKSCDSEVKKFQGAGKDWIHFDEEPPKDIFDEATIRVGGGGRRLMIFLTCTLLPPPGQAGGVTWSYDEFVKPWKRGELHEGEIFTASIYDNPHLDPLEIKRLEARYGRDTPMGRIRLGGELIPGVSGSTAYSNFQHELHVRPLGEPDPGRPLAWCWDFNVAPMCTVIGQLHRDTFKFYDEIVLEEGSVYAMVEAFYERYMHWNGLIYLYGDATGSNRDKQTSLTDYHAIFNALRPHNLNVRKKVPEKNPMISSRLNAMQYALLNEYGEHHLLVDPKCKELIEDFEGVLLDPAGGIKKSRKPQDPYYRRTGTSDAAGYWITYEKPLRDTTMDDRPSITVKNPGYGFQKR